MRLPKMPDLCPEASISLDEDVLSIPCRYSDEAPKPGCVVVDREKNCRLVSSVWVTTKMVVALGCRNICNNMYWRSSTLVSSVQFRRLRVFVVGGIRLSQREANGTT